MIHISVYSSYSRRIPPARLGGCREEVVRHRGWEIYGAAFWDRVWVPGRSWVWQRGHNLSRLGQEEEEQEGHNPSTGLNVTFPISLLAHVLLTYAVTSRCPRFTAAGESPPEAPPPGLPQQRGASLAPGTGHISKRSVGTCQWGPQLRRSPMLSFSYPVIRRGTQHVGWESWELGIL